MRGGPETGYHQPDGGSSAGAVFPLNQRRQDAVGVQESRDSELYKPGIYVKRDTQVSIAYSEERIFPISATLQSTDRHHGIVGQERCHFQLDS
jgi:hypothetical protein